MSESILVEEELEKTFNVTKEIAQESIKETEENIPNGYIKVRLPSNGKIDGIPKFLHFRDYSASESLDINTMYDEDRPKAIANVLKNMCYENFEISELPIYDILYILYMIQATFINPTITKVIKLDEESDDDSEENTEEVDISIGKLNCILLGKDKNDVDLKQQIKVPFTIKDNKTNHSVKFKFATLKDTIIAQNYCKNFYADKLLKYGSIRKKINDIQEISSKTKRNEKMNYFVENNFEEFQEYVKFTQEYELMIAKVIQSLQIVSYDDEVLDTIEKQWEVYSKKISTNIWNIYNKITEDFKFGLDGKVEVYSNKLNKKLVRTISFQFSDFISIDESKDNDRYSVSFE